MFFYRYVQRSVCLCEQMETRRLFSAGIDKTAVYDDLLAIHQDRQIIRDDRQQLHAIAKQERSEEQSMTKQANAAIAGDLHVLRQDKRKKNEGLVAGDLQHINQERAWLGAILEVMSKAAGTQLQGQLAKITTDVATLKTEQTQLHNDRQE